MMLNLACSSKLEENSKIRYIIRGDPIPLAKSRLGHRRVYDAQKQIKLVWKLALADQHMNQPMFSGSLHLDVDFFLPMPTALKKQALVRGCPHIYKPTIYDLIDFVRDMATGVLFHDDCIIASLSSTKLYADIPRTEFMITKLGSK